MADLYAKIIGTASNYLYSYVLIILLVGGGIYFTIRTKGVQLRYLLESIRVILEPSDKEDESISAFQALMVSTASRVGTGMEAFSGMRAERKRSVPWACSRRTASISALVMVGRMRCARA